MPKQVSEKLTDPDRGAVHLQFFKHGWLEKLLRLEMICPLTLWLFNIAMV